MSGNANTFVTMGGTQDNSTREMYSACLTTSIDHYDQMGDGGYCFINPANDQQRIASAWGSYYFRTLDGGTTYTDLAGTDDKGQFINPADCGIVAGQVNLFAATTGGLNRWLNVFGGGGKTPLTNAIFSQTPSAVKVSPNNSSVVYVGVPGIGANARIVKVTNANGVPNYSNITSNIAQQGYISCIEVRKNAAGTDNEIVVTFSNYGTTSVWYTSTGNNASPNWIPIDNQGIGAGALPDMPIRWALFPPIDAIANPDGHKLLLATEVGVWGTTNINTANGPTTIWQSINNGSLPNVRTQMLRIRESDNMVLAATYGRGLWRSDMYSPIKVNLRVQNAAIGTTCRQTFISCVSGAGVAPAYQWSVGCAPANTAANVTTNAYGEEIKLTVNGNICIQKDRPDLFSTSVPIDCNLPLDCAAVIKARLKNKPSEISIYPNPTTGEFYIESPTSIEIVRIYNISGQLLAEEKTNTRQINLAEQPVGVYIGHIFLNNGDTEVVKIIKN
jgi:hypothetical protein